jgi:phospholipid-binding lipoprotein MlaA
MKKEEGKPMRLSRTAGLVAAFALAAFASGCATTGQTSKKDPWEGMNRATHGFNMAVDEAVLKPVATAYVKVVPGFAREGVNNFFGNLQDLGTGINNILQGKVGDGFSDLARLGVNTTLGVFGLWDVATPMGLEKHEEDFGQTLGKWGVPSGPYFVIPLLGPSTLRDAPARYVDPQYFWGRYIDDEVVSYILLGLDVTRTRANLVQAESVLDQAAIDRYSFIRDAWLQRRRSQVYDGSPPRLKDDEDE